MILRLDDFIRHPIKWTRFNWFTRRRLLGDKGARAAWKYISLRNLSQREKDWPLTWTEPPNE